MSKFTDSLRGIDIYNPWSFAEHGQPFISYHAQTNRRSCLLSKWVVSRRGFKTDPSGPWYDHGDKSFVACRADKEDRLNEAKAWASERYGIKEWAKTPFGSWMDADYVKRRVSELKQQLKQQ